MSALRVYVDGKPAWLPLEPARARPSGRLGNTSMPILYGSLTVGESDTARNTRINKAWRDKQKALGK